MRTRIAPSIAAIPAARWNSLVPPGIPFASHEFLSALEQTSCVGPATGWEGEHLLLQDDAGVLLGAMPLYRKHHSWGEFVFDWSWARACDQAGRRYYPKLIAMTPFTPATGPRLLVAPQVDQREIRKALIRAMRDKAAEDHLSSAHVLFLDEADRAALGDSDWLWRKDCQFHWHNHGFANFADFIATFRADKRKKALRERRRIAEAGIVFRTLHGHEIDDRLWDLVFELAAGTFRSRGHEHYLNADFFRTIAATLPQAVMVKLALLNDTPIATAIFFRSADTLYGRYWGAVANFDSLHFETCYYQGIEYCIEHGLQRFEPGTQGEHKVPRGFEPAETWSAHWIADPQFRRAIGRYLEQERAAVDQYMVEAREHVPFRQDRTPAS